MPTAWSSSGHRRLRSQKDVLLPSWLRGYEQATRFFESRFQASRVQAISMNSPLGPDPAGLSEFRWDDLPEPSQTSTPSEPAPEFELDLRIVLGRTKMRLEDVLRLRSGSVVVLEQGSHDPVEIHVNDRLIAKGEVLVLDGKFCIRVTEMVGNGD